MKIKITGNSSTENIILALGIILNQLKDGDHLKTSGLGVISDKKRKWKNHSLVTEITLNKQS